jgi:hypothetical protein
MQNLQGSIWLIRRDTKRWQNIRLAGTAYAAVRGVIDSKSRYVEEVDGVRLAGVAQTVTR